MFVREVKSRLIKNSREERTIEVVLKTFEGKFVCSAPSGKSRGRSEVEPYSLKGIEHSLKMLKVFSKKLVNQNFMIRRVDDLKELVEMMRKFEARFGLFGGNVWYVLEGVFLKAAAAWCKKELWEFINDDVNSGLKPKMPMPVGNCIGGGLHSRFVDGKKPDFQEFLLIPNEKSFSHGVTKNIRAYEKARKLLRARKKNDEEAWMTDKNNEEVLAILKVVARRYGLRVGVDFASSMFYKNGYYNYKNKKLIRDKVEQVDYIERLIKKFRIFYLEDGLNQEDFGGFKQLVNFINENKKESLIVGDDLTTTNLKLVRRAFLSGSINAVIIKPNQIGSILEVKKVVKFCKKNKIVMIFSHRSGETMDDILADYCTGFGGQFLKCGIFGRERLIKLKRVMDIERSLK